MTRIHIQKGVFLFLVMLFSLGYALAQKTITGSIIDDLGQSLIGVSVLVEGTTTGTVTDIDGNYSITANQGDVLVFSYLGFVTQKATVGTESVIEVQLMPDIAELNEVIVIGYGVQKKADKTGAVAHITSEEMVGGVLTDPIQGIQGKSSGVLITKKGGDPNEGFVVKIRGASGFESNTPPLYVIDGVQDADPTALAPEDIETFDVLKDAASTAIYGSRGSNGVIIITTKKGKGKTNTVQFNVKLSVDQVAKKATLLNAEEIRNFAASTNDDEYIDGGASTDWQDEIYRTGFSQNYNLNFAGSNENSSYYASLTRADWEGVMKGTAKERTIARINLTHQALNDRLSLSGSLATTFEKNDYENYDGFDKDDIIYQAYSHNPTDPVYNEDGTYYQTSRGFNYENPIAVINEITNVRDAKRILANFRADLELFTGLTSTLNLGYTRDDHESTYFRPTGVYLQADNGEARKEYKNDQKRALDFFLTYANTLFDVHNVTVMGGYSYQDSYFNDFHVGGNGVSSNYIGANNLQSLTDIQRTGVGSYAGEWTLLGFFARAQYNYAQKYYVSGSIRRDGSSKFGKDNKWGTFPTVAVGWTLTNETFLEGLSWLNQLKLRASYGVSGNQEIGEYKSQIIFEPQNLSTNPATGQQVVTYDGNYNDNPLLGWEETSEINIGLDFALLKSRISGTLEFYTKETDKLLGEHTVPVPPNQYPRTWKNSGAISNKGIEVFAQIFAVDKSNVDWKTNFTFGYNKLITTDLGENFNEGAVRGTGYISGRGLIGEENYVTAIIEGEEYSAFYLPVYVGLASDGALLFKSKSGGITRDLSEAQREVVGSPLPDFEFGWSNYFTFFKNWYADISMHALIGNDVYNATEMFFDYNGNIPNLNGTPGAIDWSEQGRTQGPTVSSYYVEDASFLRIDNITIGYNLSFKNQNWIQNLKVYLSGNNLYTFTNYSGVDPETKIDGLSFGIDQYNTYPKARTYTVGISATF